MVCYRQTLSRLIYRTAATPRRLSLRQLTTRRFHGCATRFEEEVEISDVPAISSKRPAYLDFTRVPRRAIDVWEPWNDHKDGFEGRKMEQAKRILRYNANGEEILPLLRDVPVSPSYFTAAWFHTDRMLELRALDRKFSALPRLADGVDDGFRPMTYGEYIGTDPSGMSRHGDYNAIKSILQRLARIRHDVRPMEVNRLLAQFSNSAVSRSTMPERRKIDGLGRAMGRGKRKDARATVWIVRGEGQVLVNGKRITDVFNRGRDRQAILRPLSVVGQLTAYNIFALVQGGGTTGQAGALSLGLAKALVRFNPQFSNILRKADCLKQDLRVVERKKPGKVKARKSPQWVKR
ncbi:ribosomal protein S9/S16-domain-containing protein [Lipomyces tetrasporus]|uniref:Small ribosomal subunit protein uS9m n=1 Tax=Lipomyces tetrasporus TaxID=54092 RepID=A0AAD7VQY8_9ASCO|nr:ribosomal protein S9/S16-domain-containing protein [Lipomyces tetrasporus]KAJ8098396.1 ribosomal protein S9/S16-domain-containing protein [Lipomyces tetrasporus]